MIDWLLTDTLKGSLVFLLVAGADRLASNWMRARWRRLWWVLVPLAFLLPVQIPGPFHAAVMAGSPGVAPSSAPALGAPGRAVSAVATLVQSSPNVASWVFYLWLAGALISGVTILIPTWRAHRAWTGLRFSSDPRLIGLLEDTKAQAGVTAPIGLIVSDALAAPALLGWLRPRLLLPRALAESGSALELKAIFLHELAHFRALDVPLNWLFVVVRALHWFNPLSYAAGRAWAQFREEAADEMAIGWLSDPNPAGYGEVLLMTLGQCGGGAPVGALAIGESLDNLKRRMHMIRTYPGKSGRAALAGVIACLFVILFAFLPGVSAQEVDPATAKKEALAAMEPWLAEIDAGQYAKSWDDAGNEFRKSCTSAQWVATNQEVRAPLGKLIRRTLVSSLYQPVVPQVGVDLPKGNFVIAQFDTSFENMKYAIETVSFEKQPDGSWRDHGYLIHAGE